MRPTWAMSRQLATNSDCRSLGTTPGVEIVSRSGASRMPQRTNDFQTLVALIEAQLAPAGARVSQSKLLSDWRTGKKREVDIVIEVEVSGKPIVISVECRDHRRRADQRWIDELTGKFEHLPTDKIVAVARAGFSQAALDAAAKVGIFCLTFEQATTSNWSLMANLPRRIEFVSQLLVPLAVEVLSNDERINDFDLTEATLSIGQNSSPVLPLIDATLGTQGAAEIVDGFLARGISEGIEIHMTLPDDTRVTNRAGDSIHAMAIVVTVRVDIRTESKPFNTALYSGAGVATAVADTWPGRLTVALVNKLGTPNASIAINLRPSSQT